MGDQIHGLVDRLFDIGAIQLVVLMCLFDILDDESKGVDGLAPLVGDISDHLPQGRLAGLPYEDLVLFTVFLHLFFDFFLQVGIQIVQGIGVLFDFGYHTGRGVIDDGDFVVSLDLADIGLTASGTVGFQAF